MWRVSFNPPQPSADSLPRTNASLREKIEWVQALRRRNADRHAQALEMHRAAEHARAMAAEQRAGCRRLLEGTPRPNGSWEWAILDSNQGPPPYQSGALTS